MLTTIPYSEALAHGAFRPVRERGVKTQEQRRTDERTLGLIDRGRCPYKDSLFFGPKDGRTI
jgi:hypothetical protein